MSSIGNTADRLTYEPLSLVHTQRLRLRFRQTSRIGSMATNDGVHT